MRCYVAFSVAFIIAISSTAAGARPFRSHLAAPPECNVTMPCDFSGSNMRVRTTALRMRAPREVTGSATTIQIASVEDRGRIVGGRPAGCPHSFCGCAASIRVFGRIVPGLNLASNWLRFPRTQPAPGMVAARHGHVFVLEQHVGGDVWMAYDGNSGGRATRIHARSLRGYSVVNPRIG